MREALALLLLFGAAQSMAQDAASVLNRYVQVTGGGEIYKRYNFVHIFYTVTGAGGRTESVDYFHSRDGKTLIETDTGNATNSEGITEGKAWKYTEGKGAQILSGKEGERLLAESKGFDEDDWRVRYPNLRLVGSENVNGVACRHLELTRIDGSLVNRFYDLKSGLLVRETSNEFDESGNEQPTIRDFLRYDTFFGVRRPVTIRMKQGIQGFEIQVNNVAYSANELVSDFELPHDVVRELVAAKSKGGDLPNPVDLVDKFLAATGGKEAYEAIKTEMVKAEVSFAGENLKFPMVTYSAGNKEYSSYDIPSLGKFESGDDGRVGWETSVVMGPKLRPHGASDVIGPQASQMITWSDAAVDMETESRDQVNGTPCYLVRLGAPGSNAPKACFDEKTNLLLKITFQAADGPVEQVYSDYRTVERIKICHHLETKVAGHQASVQITEVTINKPLPNGIFDLPADVAALKAKRDAAAKNAPAAPGAPTLKKPPPQLGP